ncbi:hypothetical protein CRI93_02255 [Longimonas halophila]|uniref:DUF3078 domain-containing protein n=1 Tax=Longimonas halophila TaxID=1469170 RepID=A0A2H3P9H3_9BACT|nr:DUF3078 domain-containing protein [Longimonas halophila]PEN09575.1 hypothetical protein CRI93_02255 [Longimonas halophila]
MYTDTSDSAPQALRYGFAWASGLFITMLLMSVLPLVAQGQSLPTAPDEPDPPQEEEPHPWTYDMGLRFSGSQAAYSNWQEGGLQSVAFSVALTGEARRATEHLAQMYRGDFRIGFLNQQSEPFRKSEDVLRLQMAQRYIGDDFFKLFNPTFASVLRTQFVKGFNYDEDPFDDDVNRETPVLVSNFLSPAFFTQSLGLTYEPASWYMLRAGGAMKQTIVKDQELRPLYDVDTNDFLRLEAGAELNNVVDVEIMENVRWRSTLNVFFSFNEIESPPDVTWENNVSLRVNDWLSTELEFVALYNENVSDAVQIKEVLSVGVTFSLI